MTYCCALRLQDGLVFISDTRTNAGVDHISVFRKLYTFGVEGERFIAIQTSGNLATTQAVIGHLKNHLELSQEPNLYSVNTMFEAAELVGHTLKKVLADMAPDTQEQSNYYCSLLVGGQIKGAEMQLYNIYPQGNFICATKDTPYFQIGESKYGKPILDRSVRYDTNVNHAAQALMLSFDSTLHSNLSVGMPIDFVIYENDSLMLPKGRRIEEDDEYFKTISRQWSAALRNTLIELPECPDNYWG